MDSALNAMVAAGTFNMSLPVATKTCGLADPESDERHTEDNPISASSLSVSEVTNISSRSGSGEMDVDSGEDSASATLDKDLAGAVELYDKVVSGELSVQDVCSSRCLDKIQEKLEAQKIQMAAKRTSKLWLQYMEMVDILRLFIKAERTGEWMLHLKSLQEMLPFFAASGHNLYAKSAYIYVQQMLQLADSHPEVFAFFRSGYHVVRRSDRYWAGLSSDLVLEQTLMKTLKTTGGLARGRGMTESQRTQWLLSMPACSTVNAAMQKLTAAEYVTSDQHKDATPVRQAREDNDTRSLLDYLQHRSPFERDSSLQSIATGDTVESTVNADNAKEAGCKILQSMARKNVADFTFKKKDAVVPLGSKSYAKIDGQSLPIDPQLLFQRLLTAAQEGSENLADIFKYELCNRPPALFDPSGLPREAKKSALADAIWSVGKGVDMPAPPPTQEMNYVLDGGSLLYRLPWPRGTTFDLICTMYVDYVKKFRQPTIVFDGYEAGPSTKDTTHLRRSGGVVGAKVNFNGSTPVASKKEQFLAHANNKQRFVDMLSQKLEAADCHVVQARGDADVLIAKTAVASAAESPTTVIGEDTDLLVLLICHADLESHPLYMQSDKTKGQEVQSLGHPLVSEIL